MCFLRHAEHHARNRTSLAGLEQDLLFFGPPYIKIFKNSCQLNHNAWPTFSPDDSLIDSWYSIILCWRSFCHWSRVKDTLSKSWNGDLLGPFFAYNVWRVMKLILISCWWKSFYLKILKTIPYSDLRHWRKFHSTRPDGDDYLLWW